jgi:glycine/serine hydroxymethyltransferase
VNELRPRHYAKKILERPRARREELLARVPELWRGMTETHIRIADMWSEHNAANGRQEALHN